MCSIIPLEQTPNKNSFLSFSLLEIIYLSLNIHIDDGININNKINLMFFKKTKTPKRYSSC